jgi:hypothetical protein
VIEELARIAKRMKEAAMRKKFPYQGPPMNDMLDLSGRLYAKFQDTKRYGH